MNRVQFLLNKISQEAAELTKDCTKTAMFGLSSYDPNDETKTQNIQLVVQEYFDLVAAFEQFIDEVGVRNLIPLLNDPKVQSDYILDKQQKNEKYIQICMKIGTTFAQPLEGHKATLKTAKVSHLCDNCHAYNCEVQCGCSCDVPNQVAKEALQQCPKCNQCGE